MGIVLRKVWTGDHANRVCDQPSTYWKINQYYWVSLYCGEADLILHTANTAVPLIYNPLLYTYYLYYKTT